MAYVHQKYSTRKAQLAYCERRDASLYQFSLKGWTNAELAEKYKITPQRVGQIIRAQAALSRKTKRRAS